MMRIDWSVDRTHWTCLSPMWDVGCVVSNVTSVSALNYQCHEAGQLIMMQLTDNKALFLVKMVMDMKFKPLI